MANQVAYSININRFKSGISKLENDYASLISKCDLTQKQISDCIASGQIGRPRQVQRFNFLIKRCTCNQFDLIT